MTSTWYWWFYSSVSIFTFECNILNKDEISVSEHSHELIHTVVAVSLLLTHSEVNCKVSSYKFHVKISSGRTRLFRSLVKSCSDFNSLHLALQSMG